MSSYDCGFCTDEKRQKSSATPKLCPECFVGVRLSAAAENLSKASFTGQQALVLNVVGPKSFLECFASIYTDRAIMYDIFDHMFLEGAVVLQSL
jgi:phosphoenolpyruvate synthase/pyruvate phosphate dikinase